MTEKGHAMLWIEIEAADVMDDISKLVIYGGTCWHASQRDESVPPRRNSWITTS
jgi:hypothetical protein